jgi:hypothetical protein
VTLNVTLLINATGKSLQEISLTDSSKKKGQPLGESFFKISCREVPITNIDFQQ